MGRKRSIAAWFDSRIGIANTMLRPPPEYSLNPFYWLGGLMVMAFLIQGLTGALMLLYYVPTTTDAYPSTMYMLNSVPLGLIIQSIHHYGAYTMILLAFAHLFRNFFTSSHKPPRELMWVIGMLMGLVVFGFGLTGYLLPWTVVSKSATDVAIGMLGFMPAQLGAIAQFLLAGTGGNSGELRRFFDLHLLILPAALISLLALKLYMFEVHGPAEPPTRARGRTLVVPWFPEVFLYLIMIGGAFFSIVLAVTVMFPFSLPPEFTPAAAASYVSQPDWYFLWLYQILKFSIFEGSGIQYALGAVTVLLLILVLLPFLDRGKEREPSSRPVFITLGAILMAELIVLIIWGYLTPGQVIPDIQAITITGGVALLVTLAFFVGYKSRSRSQTRTLAGGQES
jgi:ubiquinol-cytochrome c reductase cytochrome b subunit